MQGTIKLKNPIKVNGAYVSEMDYDTNEITGELFAMAESKKKAAGSYRDISVTVELDFSLHLYMGFAAIIAKNPKISFDDLAQVKGRDVIDVMAIGRNFILRSEDGQPDDDSEKLIETTQGSTIPALPISEAEE
ncbi:MAG TPA: hypothetical protein IAB44_12080 [Candidatus Limivivens intestinipullorum]|uniref:Uncharacterized protein n=1 Tax=Candidatus Limivivens intestinipullorum TaxID=2840858 RepID=A0A9D1EUM1_9FIRM|nr:hypothetical protein [Candidatus Limivivens intestinipullorum]